MLVPLPGRHLTRSKIPPDTCCQVRKDVVNAPVSIRDVAAHAGVSVGAVSNVLNRPDIVARPTREPIARPAR